ncbi:MAG: Mth938-like domain-containing protein [Candidatus Aminicenantales bacterium]
MIDSYAFGRIVIHGTSYTSDVIVYPERVDGSWWRKNGHRLCLEDLEDVLKEEFDVLVVGTGYMGVMQVDKELVRNLRSRGLEVIIQNTRKAVETFNALKSQKRVIGAFHITC